MRAKYTAFFSISSLVIGALPLVAAASLLPFMISDTPFIGMPMIPSAPYGIYQTALKTGDTYTFQVDVHSIFALPPTVSADLSQLGVPSSNPVSGGPSHYYLNYTDYYPNYFHNFGPFVVGADIPDGLKTIPVVATDLSGNVATTTARILVDNILPNVSLTSITFSTTSPGKGDYVYLSGSVSGTGSAVTVREITEGLFDANGVSLPGSFNGDMIGYDPQSIMAMLTSPTGGTFTNVPIQLFEFDIGQIARAASFRVRISAYDEAGNSAASSLTVPVPKPPPPDPCAAPGSCASNVLFLPGLEASRLYRPDYAGGEKKLWEPGLNDLLQDLYLTPEGKSVRADVYAKEDDVVDEVPVTGANIYKSFIAKMNELRDVKKLINDWEAVPYDWRLSLDDILANGKRTGARISYLDATSTPYVVQELKSLAASSKTHKVTVVAHSNGGLVAKRLTQVLGVQAPELIDKMIFVAVPQAGTPAAVAAALHGYGQNFGFGPVVSVSQATARTFASTSPMTYNLLPSASYFTQVDNPVVSFAPSLPDWITRYGATIHSAETLRTFLTDAYGRVDAQTGDISQPLQTSAALLASAEALHANLDSWTPPAGVELVQIAGWGVPTTVTGLTYKKKEKGTGVEPEPNLTIDGDGTVVVPSALWTNSASTTRYWMDLNDYNRDHPVQSGFGLATFNHSRILEPVQLLDFLSDRITNTTKPLSDYTYLSTEAPPSTDIRLRYALHSPLTLNLYDSGGRHTGVSTTTGQVEMQIPGTYYAEFGDVKYLFSDAIDARIIMEGYDTDTFTFNVDEYSGDTLTASTTFKDIPTTASTNVTLDIQSDLTTLSPMQIDKNGDGVIDAMLMPRLNDTVTLDTTPPEIRISFGTTTKSLLFIGTDDSGTATITTSTLYPKIKKNQKEPRGVATTTVTARDEAGNTTALVYTEHLPSPKERDAITLWSLAYNDAVTKIASTTLAYKWRNKKNGAYQVFASHLRTASSALESHYRPKKDITVIMAKPSDLDDSDRDDDSDARPVKQELSGMVIPYLSTEKGILIIGY